MLFRENIIQPLCDVRLKAVLRFYEELNDYLPPERRKVSFDHAFEDGASVSSVLAAVGVPEQQVDLVLVNGESANLDHQLRDKDRISVYPVFESFDVSELARLEGRPLRQLRFVVDTRLGRLAAYLRMLGFDTLFERACRDAELVAVSQREKRILLTRDQRLLMHRGVTRGHLVPAEVPRIQLAEVLAHFDLAGAVKPFQRCLRCNALMEEAKKAEVLFRVPFRIRAHYERFWVCPGCGRVYWQGSHFRRMRNFIDQTLRAARTRTRPPEHA